MNMMDKFIGMPKATFYENELAGELAELFIEMKYEGQNVSIYNIKDGELRYTDKVQDEYNDVLERIESYIQLNKI